MATASLADTDTLRGPLGGPRVVRLIGLNLLVAAGYGLLGLAVAAFFAAFGLFPAPIWLPSSVAIVAALLAGPAIAPGIFAGSLLTNAILFAPPLWVSIVISATNAAGPILAALLIRRVAQPAAVFASIRGLGAFVGAGILLHAGITATGGALTAALALGADGPATAANWLSWWLSDSGGTLFLAPALLLWLTDHRDALSRARLVEGVVVSAATVAAAALLFSRGGVESTIIVALPYLLALPLAWVTLRWSLRSATTLFTVIATIATAATIAGSGPFNLMGVDRPLTALGTMIVLCGINVLLTAALVSERRDMVDRLAAANRVLEARVADRTRDLEAARAAAEAANAAKSQFLANMTHDLRTPLNGVIGFAGALRYGAYGPLGDARQDEALALIERSGRHLLALVDGLLDMAKIEAGRLQLDLAPVTLAPLLDDARSLLQPMASGSGVRLDLAPVDPALQVQGDARALSQILHNLISNAIKFNRPGGTVTVAVGIEGRAAIIHVGDDGPGMSPAELATALEPFGRADNQATRADRSGSGLGLPLARALAEGQGGRFAIDSMPGRGTMVRITLPLSEGGTGPLGPNAAPDL